MLVNFVRAIIIYIIVLVVMRLMGKREIGQLQPFELVISIMIADLASIPMTDTGVPIFNGIVPILGLLAMHLLITVLNIKSVSIRKITCGKPTILVYRGKIDEETLKKERFTVSELQERLRGKDVFNLGDVEYAILETNGEVSVIQKPNKRNTIPEDFSIEPEYEGLPYDLIVDGKIMYENLSKIGKDEKWLQKQIVKFKTTPENVLIATMDGKGNFFCQNKSEKRRKRKMRREAVITIVIILVIIIGEWLTQSYSKKTLGGVQDSLRELKEEILSSEIEVSELIKKTNQIYDKWEEDNQLLSYYLEHDELEKINTQVVLIRGFLESDTPQDAIPEIEEGIYILEHIKEKEKLSIKNVF